MNVTLIFSKDPKYNGKVTNKTTKLEDNAKRINFACSRFGIACSTKLHRSNRVENEKNGHLSM